MMKKVLIIAAGDNFNFIRDIGDALKKDFDVKLFDTEKVMNARYTEKVSWWERVMTEIKRVDLVWLEWADGLPLEIITKQNPRNFPDRKIILRIHRYELFNPHLLNRIKIINQERLNALVFVSEYVWGIFAEKFPIMSDDLANIGKDKTHIIPNLIDIDKFPFHERDRGYNLLFLGRVSYVKNLPLMLTMFHELLKLDPNYMLHIVGEITDPEVHYYQDNFINKLGIEDNVKLYGHIPNDQLPDFMKEMSFICCSSIFESQGVGILEGMATGLKPVIFNFPGAENFFPDKWLYMDRSKFIMRIMEPGYKSELYRQFVLDRYSIQKNLRLYKNLINEVLKGD